MSSEKRERQRAARVDAEGVGWARELWIESLGMPAVLPPPEEEKKVTTAIGGG